MFLFLPPFKTFISGGNGSDGGSGGSCSVGDCGSQ